MPTGIALHDAREQLFQAAERALLRGGPSALTSRAVTAEAGCAKGVLHRHFDDFDEFLAELVTNRVVRLRAQAGQLLAAAGTGTVTENLAVALTELFEPVAVAIVALVISRDGLRARLRRSGLGGVPLLSGAVNMIASYLRAEQELGRVDKGADVATLAPTMVGATHLLFANREAAHPEPDDVRRVVAAVVAQALPAPAQ
ncbi:MAG TPA: TetR family transcriptional regulator [Acidimicrobiales bacterium]|nr:TetR family transcriptional regulator [Acidimicrobiales bacterium]